MSTAVDPALQKEITLTRVFAAPREKVFDAWTKAESLKVWWGPGHGFTNPSARVDLRVGGEWQIVMRAPDGNEMPCAGIYKEIDPPKRLVFTNDVVAPDGTLLLEGLTTVILEEEGNGTKQTLIAKVVGHVPFAAQMIAGMEEGWSGSLVQLGDFLAGV